MKTYTPKPGEIKRNWLLIDLKDQVLGRAAAQIAMILRGKTKPTYTPHVDTGDFVVVINADKVKVTGKKETEKKYNFHSGYIGGLKTLSTAALRAKRPEDLITLAVKGMLPKTVMGRNLLKKLKVYASETHPHLAQTPNPIVLKA